MEDTQLLKDFKMLPDERVLVLHDITALRRSQVQTICGGGLKANSEDFTFGFVPLCVRFMPDILIVTEQNCMQNFARAILMRIEPSTIN